MAGWLLSCSVWVARMAGEGGCLSVFGGSLFIVLHLLRTETVAGVVV